MPDVASSGWPGSAALPACFLYASVARRFATAWDIDPDAHRAGIIVSVCYLMQGAENTWDGMLLPFIEWDIFSDLVI